MAALNDQLRLHVVQRLACFYTPSEIVKELKDVFSHETSIAQIMHYDPNTANGAKELSQEWKTIFAETRKEFLENTKAIPIANQSYRLRKLQQLIEAPNTAKNAALIASLLEQAAKEEGGMYTNRREISGPQGAAIPINIQDVIDKVYGDDKSAEPTGDLPIS